jgi:hypothetical protein
MPAALKYKFKRSETLSTNLLPMISLSLKPINVKLQVIIIASPVSIWLLRYCDDIRDTYIREMQTTFSL